MFRISSFLVLWTLSLGLGLSLQGDLIGQEDASEEQDSIDELESSTKQAIEFLTKTVKNAKIEFRFETPDRKGGHEFADGTKVPPTIAPGQLFEVEGAFKVTGEWKKAGNLKGRQIRMEIPIQGIPVFSYFDESARMRIRKDEGIDWKSWGFDEPKDRPLRQSKDGTKPNPTESAKPKSKVQPRPDGERKMVIDFVLNSNNGKINHEGTFAFRWKSTGHQWAPGTYYKIVAASNDGLCVTTRAGVFSGAIEHVPPAKRLSRIAYYVLGFLGYEPDPFYWLK